MDQDVYMKCDRQMCLPNNYSKTNMARYECSDNPMEVFVEFRSIKIIEIDDTKLSITLKMMLWIYWTDPRIIVLNVSSAAKSLPANVYDGVPIDNAWVNHLWFPEIYIYELKGVRKYKTLEKDTDSAGL